MSDELDWGCDPRDFTDLEDQRRIIADTDWISASDAHAIVSQGAQDSGQATDAICLHAKHGEILAKARRWITIENGQRYEKTDEPIPRVFWADHGMKQDWLHGNFVSTIYPDDMKFEIEALGVTFERAGIEVLVPRKTGEIETAASVQPLTKNRGGRPAIYDWAVAVGSLVFQWVEKGTWHPKDEKEVRKWLHDYFMSRNQYPDNNLLKKYAEWLFQEFEKRKE